MSDDCNDWFEFYNKRINSTYQDYFNKRYSAFLRYILQQGNPSVFEMGCGIGSVGKFLDGCGFHIQGFDICPEMVKLANKNIGMNAFKVGDIFTEAVPNYAIGVSHGVLEHFTDEQILQIAKNNANTIHYVPLDKYITPSFGDERLLPYQHWIDLINPKEWFLFNDDYDLCFKI